MTDPFATPATHPPPWGLLARLTPDGKFLDIAESREGQFDMSDYGGAVIGYDEHDQPIWAGRDTNAYLDFLIHRDPDMILYFHDNPEIPVGLRNGTITIRHTLLLVPDVGTKLTAVFLAVDPAQLHLDDLGD